MEQPKPPDEEPLSKAEREALLGAMSPGDWGRAESLARAAAHGLTDMTAEDLLQETLTDLLGEERTWQRGVHPLVTLKVAMHSVASNAKKKVENAPIDQFAVVSTGEEEAPEEGCPLPVHAVQYLGPQDTLEGRQQLAAIEQLVQGDCQAELVLMAWAMGFSGAEARQETGLDTKQFDAARQRLLRKLKSAAAARKTK
jgi:DNA-directed RNA polymerase specialized sigma24 family protein